MNREQAETLLAQYLLDELDEPARSELAEYLKTDAELSEQLGDMRLAAGLLRKGLAHGEQPRLSDERRIKLFWKTTAREPAGPYRLIAFTQRWGLAAAAVILLALGVVGILMPSLGTARRTARQMLSNTQLRGIHQGMVIYAQKNAGRYPDDLSALVTGGFVTPDYLISPRDDTQVPRDFDRMPAPQKTEWVHEHGSYVALGLGESDEMDAERIAGFEKFGDDKAGVSVVYKNGRVEYLLNDEAREAIEAQTGQKVEDVTAAFVAAGRGQGYGGSGYAAGDVGFAGWPSTSNSQDSSGSVREALVRQRGQVKLSDSGQPGGSPRGYGRYPDSGRVISGSSESRRVDDPFSMPSSANHRGNTREALVQKQYQAKLSDLRQTGGYPGGYPGGDRVTGDRSEPHRLYAALGAPDSEDRSDKTAEGTPIAGKPLAILQAESAETLGLRTGYGIAGARGSSARGSERQPDFTDAPQFDLNQSASRTEAAGEWRGGGVLNDNFASFESRAGDTLALNEPTSGLASNQGLSADGTDRDHDAVWSDAEPKARPDAQPASPAITTGTESYFGEVSSDADQQELASGQVRRFREKTDASQSVIDGNEIVSADEFFESPTDWPQLTEKRLAEANKAPASTSRAESAPEPETTPPPPIVVPVNPWVMTQRDRHSTFALDVDTASYAIAARYIRDGVLPPVHTVRMEEFVNAFDYNYPAGRDSARAFAVHAEAGPSPFGQGTTLLKIGVRGRVIGRDQLKPAHLVFVVDVSGSMDKPDRLPLVREGLALLLGQLAEHDRVSLVTYDTEAHLLLEAVPAGQKQQILGAIEALQTRGSTNLMGGLNVGYQVALRGFMPGGVNRVILCSDGVANVGAADAEQVLDAVAEYRAHGISFTSVGFGTGSYDDRLLEQLANKGDGSYLFVGSPDEARRLFVEDMAATLPTIARNAKIQVEFNPNRVRRYRLIGYENRDIADADFRNDRIDAGEVGSGQSATALYELELLDVPENGPAASDLGTVYVRYENAETGRIDEIATRLDAGVLRPRTPRADPRFYLAAAAAEFAEILRQSEHVDPAEDARASGTGNFEPVRRVLVEVTDALPLDRRARELLELVERAEGLPRAPR